MTDQEVWLRLVEAILESNTGQINTRSMNSIANDADLLLREFKTRFPVEPLHMPTLPIRA